MKYVFGGRSYLSWALICLVMMAFGNAHASGCLGHETNTLTGKKLGVESVSGTFDCATITSPSPKCAQVAEEAVKVVASSAGSILGGGPNCQPSSKDQVQTRVGAVREESTFQIFAAMPASCGSEWEVVVHPSTCLVLKVENKQIE